MTEITPLDRLHVPLGGQEIELQQVDFEAGGMAMLRVRIRERNRFTIFDLDPVTTLAWAEAMQRWALAQPGMEVEPGSSARA
jgi:nicotinamide riboside kinase